MTESEPPLLTANDVHVWRGERHLLRGVSFAVRAGEFLQLIGPNGVGKTTLLRVACGLLPTESGEILWRGAPIANTREEFNGCIAYLAHSNALKPDLTAIENLRYELSLRRTLAPSEVIDTLTLLGIAHCAQLPMRVLSAGQRRRLALARVLLSRTMLWILDEPTTNLDSAGVVLIEGLMRDHLQKGGAILTAAHHGLLAGHAAARNLDLSS